MANLKKNWTDNAYFQNLDQKCLFSNGPKMLISKWTKNGHFQKNWTDNVFQNLDEKCQFSMAIFHDSFSVSQKFF